MEKNILIALFLGFQETKEGYFDAEEVLLPLNIEGTNTFDAWSLKFNSDWNWIMIAVEKISDIIGYSLNATLDFIGDGFGFDGLYNIEDVSEAVLEFVKKENSSNPLRQL